MKKNPNSACASAFAALLFTSTSLVAAPMGQMPSAPAGADVIRVQEGCQPGDPRPACARGRNQGGERPQRRQAQPEQQGEQPQRPRRQAQPQQQPEQPQRPRRQAQPEQQPEQPQRPRRQAQPEQQPEQPQRPRRQAQPEQQPEQPQRPRRQAQPEQQPEQPQRPRRQAQPEQQPEQPQRPRRQAQPEQQPEQPPVRRQAQPEQPTDQPEQRPRRQAQPEQPTDQPPVRRQAQPEQPTEQPEQRPRRQAQPEQPTDQPAQRPRRQAETPTDTPELRPGQDENGQQQPRPRDRRQAQPDGAPGTETLPEGGRQQTEQRPRDRNARPIPRDDRAAQERVRPERVRSVTEERGERIEGEPQPRPRLRRPQGTEVLREVGGRVILQYGDQIAVENNDRPRLRRNAQQIYAENLPGGRVRETVIRRDGTRVVTIRNENGDILRRSRFTNDDREIVLVYVEDDDIDRLRDWRDPGLDLPPLVLDIPREEYILDAEPDYSADDYYTFLEQPPVEDVERLYSVDEVKRSARIRQKTRRVDLDTVTFEFGSSAVPEDQISKLEGVAEAMQRMLQQNPGETFLIEGHTDAVGSEYANLALSDQRAEAVADALSNVFEIPPENLSTQGYGEEFLKVQTSEPERENRRVAIRRITPLVAPVASAN